MFRKLIKTSNGIIADPFEIGYIYKIFGSRLSFQTGILNDNIVHQHDACHMEFILTFFGLELRKGVSDLIFLGQTRGTFLIKSIGNNNNLNIPSTQSQHAINHHSNIFNPSTHLYYQESTFVTYVNFF